MAAGHTHRHRTGPWPIAILVGRALTDCTSTYLLAAAGQGLESHAVRLDDGDRDVSAFAGVDVTHGALFPLVGSFHHAAEISVLYHALKEQKKGDRIAAISLSKFDLRDFKAPTSRVLGRKRPCEGTYRTGSVRYLGKCLR